MTHPAPLTWKIETAGHYTSGEFTIRRDAAASSDNRWSLRRGGKPVSAHRLLASAKSRAAVIAGEATAEVVLTDTTAEAYAMNDRFNRLAAQTRRGGTPELFGPGTPVNVSTTSQGGVPTELQPGTVIGVVRATMRIALDSGGVTMALRGTYVERRKTPPCAAAAAGVHCSPACFRSRGADCENPLPPAERGPIDKAAILAKPIDSLMHSGARQPMTAQPQQQQAQADEPAPFAVNDVVWITPGRGRQFEIVQLDDIDGLVQVTPRNMRTVDDGPRWVGTTYMLRVPADQVEPVADDDEPECEGHESLAGGDMGATVHCDGTCVQRGPAVPVFVDPWARTATPEPAADDQGDGAVPQPVRRGDRCVEAVAGTGAYVHVVVDADGLVHDGHDVDQCPNPPSISAMLRPAMPGQYRDVLTHLLTGHGFAPPTGIDIVAPDDANPQAFLIHDPTGIAVGTYERHVRLSYPAEHAGEGDGDIGAAYVDLEYGTSFETVADVAVGLVGRLMRRTHADHMRGIADQLRDWVGPEHASSEVWLRRADLAALADQLAPADTECKAAGYARRVTAVLHGVLGVLMDMTADRQPVEHELLRALVLGAAGAVTGPEPTADELVEHLAGRGVGAALVADDSAGPADADMLVETLRGAGWRESPDHEYVAGRRVRYLTPPAGWQAGIHDGGPTERQTQNADGEMQTAEAPLTQAQVDAAECGEAFQTSARFGHTYYCARPPHGEDAFGHSVMRYPYGAPRPEPVPAGPVDDELPAGTTLLSADELVDAGGFLMCGCHGSATEHSCGAAAPDTFDPSAEV